MTAEELMIGDWVKMYNGKGEYIDDTRVDIHTLYTFSQDGQNVLRLEPIPLTPEILEKNGFKLVDNRKDYKQEYMLDIDPQDIWGVVSFWEDGTILVKVESRAKSEGVNNVHNCDIRSVHELQHAMRLCGISKEIVL